VILITAPGTITCACAITTGLVSVPSAAVPPVAAVNFSGDKTRTDWLDWQPVNKSNKTKIVAIHLMGLKS
jgi:hypothetical protein